MQKQEAEYEGGARVIEVAYAKINLALHIRGRRPDTYHELDTIFAFADFGDKINIIYSDGSCGEINAKNGADNIFPDGDLAGEISCKGDKLFFSGPFSAPLLQEPVKDNLIARALNLWRREIYERRGIRDETRPFLIALEKNLPISSGIGGGSADAAAFLRAVNALSGDILSRNELADLARPLGADVPACIYSCLSRGRGTGADLTLLPPLPNEQPLALLLVNPMFPVSTKEIFSAYDGVDTGPICGESIAGGGVILEGNPPYFAPGSGFFAQNHNTLERIAGKIYPQIYNLLAELIELQPIIARMSGSGATCFALFEQQKDAQAAAVMMKARHQDYWIKTGRLL